MYRSIETRWFFEQPSNSLEEWYRCKGLEWRNNWDRSDFYYTGDRDPGHSIKFREQKLEFKKLVEFLGVHRFLGGITGRVERWVKISIPLRSGVNGPPDIFESTVPFLEVKKERLMVLFEIMSNGISREVKNPGQPVNAGCLCEYSKIRFSNQTWFTFAFETFGHELDPISSHYSISGSVLEELKEAGIGGKDSFSYPAFLFKAGQPII